MIGPATVGGIKTTPWKTRRLRICIRWNTFFSPAAHSVHSTKAWVHSHWQHRRVRGESAGRPVVDGLLPDFQVVCWTMWSCRDFIDLDRSVSPALLLSFFSKSVYVHMTIRLRFIFGTLRSDDQLARCDATGCLCLQVWRYVK